jgi:O-methyltransferase
VEPSSSRSRLSGRGAEPSRPIGESSQAAYRVKRTLARWLLSRYSLRLDKANNLALVRAWIRANRPAVKTVATREELYKFLNDSVAANLPIDLLEFGVYRGESLRAWSRTNDCPTSRFWGFDSFRGLPENWVPGFDRGTYDLSGTAPQFGDARVRVVKGDFQNTLPAFLQSFQPASRLVVHVDCDLYSSTLYCLCNLDRRLIPGTIVVFDEYSVPLHEFRALRDYSASFRREFRPVAMVGEDAEQVGFVVE